MNRRFVVITSVHSLYVIHTESEEVFAGPFPRPDGWETAQSIADNLNGQMVWQQYKPSRRSVFSWR